MKIIAITQARVGSSRLPAKILKKFNNKTFLEIHLERVLKSKFINKLIVATTSLESEKPIIQICEKLGISFYKGSEDDVLDRFYKAIEFEDVDYVVRLTSDCPLIDPKLIDEIIKRGLDKKVDYISNTLTEDFPDGQDVELIKFESLERAWKESSLKSDREHVTPYIRRNSTFYGEKKFMSSDFISSKNYNNVRMTIDEIEDYNTLINLLDCLGINKSWKEYADFLVSNPQIVSNNLILRNEGYIKSKNNE